MITRVVRRQQSYSVATKFQYQLLVSNASTKYDKVTVKGFVYGQRQRVDAAENAEGGGGGGVWQQFSGHIQCMSLRTNIAMQNTVNCF